VLAADIGDDAMAGILREAIFQGDHVRLKLALGDNGDMVVKRMVAGGRLPEPGSMVSVAWNPEHALAFPAD
jgi:hypothetical protein